MRENLFVIILTYIVPIEEIDQHRPAHLNFLDRYYAQNIFLASGRQIPLNGGVILAKCASKQKLEEILAEDSFYIHQLAKYDIYEFTPNKYHEAIGKILSK